MAITHDATEPTGIKDTSPRGSGQGARAKERKANSALALKQAGATWEEIAEIVGYPSGRAAHNAVELALERELQSEWSKRHMRTLMSKRLEKLLRAVWGKATDPNCPEQLAAVREARGIMTDDAKLQGLQAPTEFVVSSPTITEIEAWVNRNSPAAHPELAEGDIFDAEVVDEGMVNDPEPRSQTVNEEQEA